MASMSAFIESVNPSADPPMEARKRAGNIIDGTTGVPRAR